MMVGRNTTTELLTGTRTKCKYSLAQVKDSYHGYIGEGMASVLGILSLTHEQHQRIKVNKLVYSRSSGNKLALALGQASEN